MPSLNYNSGLNDLARGAIDFDTDTFRMMLVTDAYVPNQDTHAKRSDVTNEVVGTGYVAGGAVITPTIVQDNGNNRLDITFSNPSWPSATITARAGVIYKSRGGAASADELVCYVDFNTNVSSTNATFQVNMTSPLRFQN